MSELTEFADVPTTGSVILPPAPRYIEALGRNHKLPAALAELVDNSIDASATNVLIRFVLRSGRIAQILVVDDGVGMNESELDAAMTVGGDQDYDESAIGRFGFGLKAASFSQADLLTVLTRRAPGQAAGRRWRLERAKEDFSCEIVAQEFAEDSLSAEWELPPSSRGTIVRWDAVRGFPLLGSDAEMGRFLQKALTDVTRHLGLIYHRLLEREKLRIFLDVHDVDEGPGQRIEVQPLDPFGYPRTGVPGWPKLLALETGQDSSAPIDLVCHIWPGRSTLEQFQLDGDVQAHQGLYVYYRERLIQQGGWNDLVNTDKQLNLARSAIDVGGDIEGFLTIKPEKNGIEPGPRFRAIIASASASDGTTFLNYLEASRSYLKEVNQRRRLRTARKPPGSGFAPKVRKTIEREIPMKDSPPLSIRWAPLGDDRFFEVDLEESTLWLNKCYRPVLLNGHAGGLNDLPVMKALLYLLVEGVFSGEYLGPRDKDNIDLWQTILMQAAASEDT